MPSDKRQTASITEDVEIVLRYLGHQVQKSISDCLRFEITNILTAFLIVIAVAPLLANNANAQTGIDRKQPVNEVEPQKVSPEVKEANQLFSRSVKLYSEGKFDSALPLAERVLEIREKILGADHSLVVAALNNLAAIYSAQRKYDQAKALYQRVVAVLEKTLGQEDINLGMALERYACLMRKMNQQTEASQLATRANVILFKSIGGNPYFPTLHGAQVKNGKVISQPQPSYPEEARRVRAQGAVTVQVVIDEAGNVILACAEGNTNLLYVSERAALKARYTPTLVNGKPVNVASSITYNFVPR